MRAVLSAGMVRETMNRVVMRKPPLVNFVPRFAAADTRLGNYTIHAGDPVWVSSAAAHADPVFAGQTAPGSSTISSRAHLSWGAGPRQCPARELASTIAAAGVNRVFERFAHLELALPVDQLPWRSSPFMRGCARCPCATNSPSRHRRVTCRRRRLRKPRRPRRTYRTRPSVGGRRCGGI